MHSRSNQRWWEGNPLVSLDSIKEYTCTSLYKLYGIYVQLPLKNKLTAYGLVTPAKNHENLSHFVRFSLGRIDKLKIPYDGENKSPKSAKYPP